MPWQHQNDAVDVVGVVRLKAATELLSSQRESVVKHDSPSLGYEESQVTEAIL